MGEGFLTDEDDLIVSRALELIPEPERVYRIHGDCGAHNFFFGEDGELTAVIDPMPILGYPLYDLLFAFCSTPDDLSPETLAPALNRLKTSFKSSEVIDPFIRISLYIRLGRAPTHQPDQLQAYREAWNRWTERI
ncbi:phosphotransferase [Cohnella kolymensis]|uniref:phosphotransferase n=1 Tax=Cohnella kolymensis TaxID=1590652 RepID=UPI0006991950|nr:phosphotransferase [Cohnella kolymensis]